MIEGVANLILSIALVPSLGIVGDALAPRFRSALRACIFAASHEEADWGPGRNVFAASVHLPVLLTLPLVGALLLANRFFYPRNLIQLVLETLAVSSYLHGWNVLGLSHAASVSCSGSGRA